MPVINVPAVIREKLGEEGTEALIKIFNEIEKNIKGDSIDIVEEKFERRLSEEMSKMRGEIEKTKAELRSEIEKTKAELRVEISETKAYLVRWMFIFWAGQIAVIIYLFSLLK